MPMSAPHALPGRGASAPSGGTSSSPAPGSPSIFLPPRRDAVADAHLLAAAPPDRSKSPSPQVRADLGVARLSGGRFEGRGHLLFRGLSVKRRAAPHVTDATGARARARARHLYDAEPVRFGLYQFWRQLFRSALRASLHAARSSPQGVSGAIGVAWATWPAYAYDWSPKARE